MQEFITAAREDFDPEADESVTFKHDGREVTFFKPTSAQFALVAAASQGSDWDQAGGFLSTFFAMAEEDTHRYFWARLMDRKDPFDIDGDAGVAAIMQYLLEHWSARPTKQPSDFQRPRSATGSRSTATTRAKGSTSSASRRAGSSTSSRSG